MKRTARGLTLIELLVAIAIFAVLGIMSWRAVSTTLTSRDALRGEFATWQRLARVLARVDNDLLQVSVRGQTGSQSLPAMSITKLDTGATRLVFWRMLDSTGSRLTGFEFSENRLWLLRWRTDDYTLEPHREPLLNKVMAVRWSFLDLQQSSTWQQIWPPQPTRVGDLPAGVRLELELEGIGVVSRIYALR